MPAALIASERDHIVAVFAVSYAPVLVVNGRVTAASGVSRICNVHLGAGKHGLRGASFFGLASNSFQPFASKLAF